MVTLQLTRGMTSYPLGTKGIIRVKIIEDETLDKVLAKAKVDLREVSIVLRNQQKIDLHEKVKPGDTLQVLPVISGG